MKSDYVNLAESPAKELSGNYNYGLFCGRKDTIMEVKTILGKYELPDELMKEINEL